MCLFILKEPHLVEPAVHSLGSLSEPVPRPWSPGPSALLCISLESCSQSSLWQHTQVWPLPWGSHPKDDFPPDPASRLAPCWVPPLCTPPCTSMAPEGGLLICTRHDVCFLCFRTWALFLQVGDSGAAGSPSPHFRVLLREVNRFHGTVVLMPYSSSSGLASVQPLLLHRQFSQSI